MLHPRGDREGGVDSSDAGVAHEADGVVEKDFIAAHAAYTARIIDVPASTGYGEPIQKLFKFGDGERVVAGQRDYLRLY